MSSKLLLAGLLVLPGLALGDTVTFKNGSRMEGVATVKGDVLEVRVPEGSFYFARSLVASITSATTPLQEFEKRKAALPAKDAKAAYDLGVYCEAHGMKAQAAEMFRRATALQPDHEAAHRGLGHRKVDGRWMTREELLKDLGLVLVNGEWMSPRTARELADLEARTRSLETRLATMEIESAKLQTALERGQRESRESDAERRIAQLEGELRGLKSTTVAQTAAPVYPFGYYGYGYPYTIVQPVPVYTGRSRGSADTYPPKFGRLPLDPIPFHR